MIPHHKHLKLDGTGAFLKVNQIDSNQLEITVGTANDKSFKGLEFPSNKKESFYNTFFRFHTSRPRHEEPNHRKIRSLRGLQNDVL